MLAGVTQQIWPPVQSLDLVHATYTGLAQIILSLLSFGRHWFTDGQHTSPGPQGTVVQSQPVPPSHAAMPLLLVAPLLLAAPLLLVLAQLLLLVAPDELPLASAPPSVDELVPDVLLHAMASEKPTAKTETNSLFMNNLPTKKRLAHQFGSATAAGSGPSFTV